MGSYSPATDLPADLVEFTMDQVVAPVMKAMAADGHPYIGFLYVGYVLTDSGPSVLEFNCRLGDPETQAVVPLLESDLAELLMAAATGDLGSREPQWNDQAAVNVVMAAQGYPVDPRRGDRIKGLANLDPGTLVFHAGTGRDDGPLVTAGGRVLNVVGLGSDVESARQSAYAAVGRIRFHGMQFRSDIAADVEGAG